MPSPVNYATLWIMLEIVRKIWVLATAIIPSILLFKTLTTIELATGDWEETHLKLALYKKQSFFFFPLQKVLYFICILYLFYCYHTYFNPILILSSSILLLFSLIRKFYCCFASIETLFYKAVVYFTPVLLYQTTK